MFYLNLTQSVIMAHFVPELFEAR